MKHIIAIFMLCLICCSSCKTGAKPVNLQVRPDLMQFVARADAAATEKFDLFNASSKPYELTRLGLGDCQRNVVEISQGNRSAIRVDYLAKFNNAGYPRISVTVYKDNLETVVIERGDPTK